MVWANNHFFFLVLFLFCGVRSMIGAVMVAGAACDGLKNSLLCGVPVLFSAVNVLWGCGIRWICRLFFFRNGSDPSKIGKRPLWGSGV